MPAIVISKRRGFITPLAMVAAIFLFIIGMGLLTLGFHRRLYSIRSNHQLNARCAADYGLTKAVFEMNSHLSPLTIDDDNLPAGSNLTILGNDATYSYSVSGSMGNYSVRATGRSGSQTKTVLCDLRLKSAFEYAILTKNTLDIGSCSEVDCVGCGNISLKIGTTNNPDAEIILKPNSTVNGDILIGQDGTPEVIIGSGAVITGGIYAVATDFDLPTPTVPSYLNEGTATNFGTINIDNGASRTLTAADSGVYEGINLKNSAFLTISGNVELYVKNNIILGNSAHIDVDPGSTLTIYLAGSLEGKYGTGFSNSGDPSQLAIYGLYSGAIDIKNSDEFHGTIYAPDASVQIDNNVKIFGSVIAKDYKQNNSAIFTYDASLRTASIEDDFVRFVPTHWREQ
ncbi:MAG: hypothetical protein ABII09_01040 [Planctomycetota bacterium]